MEGKKVCKEERKEVLIDPLRDIVLGDNIDLLGDLLQHELHVLLLPLKLLLIWNPKRGRRKRDEEEEEEEEEKVLMPRSNNVLDRVRERFGLAGIDGLLEEAAIDWNLQDDLGGRRE